MKFITVFASFVALAIAAPIIEDVAVEARDESAAVEIRDTSVVVEARDEAIPAVAARDEHCYVAPNPNQAIVSQVRSIIKSRGASYIEALATYETALVESNFQNLPCGNLDSVGVFQQRRSQGWKDPMNVNTATNAFFDALIRCTRDPNRRGRSAGWYAQCAQISANPGAYDRMESKAKALLGGWSDGSGGGNPGGATNVGNQPGNSSGGGGGGGSCKKHKTAKKGDTCNKLRGSTSLARFRQLNKGVNAKCTNIQVGKSYCVA